MDNLEKVIRDLAARGELGHISLTPSQATGEPWSAASKKPPVWRASFQMCSKFGISHAEDADPVKAITLACTSAKMAPQRAPKRNVTIDGEFKRTRDEPSVASDDHNADDLM